MPATDPSLKPPGSTGPFSRYLDAPLEGQLAEETAPPQRPSGFMGTGGKIAMFGAEILKGLQRGKMMAYARREQEKAGQFESAARRVQAIQQDPDIPNEVKAQAGNLLAQSWGTMTKEQIQESKKFHGKQGTGPGSHVLGFFEHIADKLGGPTPAEHTLGGTKDTRQSLDKLNELLADVHTGGDKYSTKAQVAQLQTQINEAARPFVEKFDRWGAALDPNVTGLLTKLDAISPEQGKAARDRLKVALAPSSMEEQKAENLRRIQSYQPKPQPQSQPQQGIAGGSVAGASASTEPIRQPAPSAGGNTYPRSLPDGTVVKNSRDEQDWLDAYGGTVGKDYIKRTIPGPNNTTTLDHREIQTFSKFPGAFRDKLTGEWLDPTGWKPSSQTEHEATQKGRIIKRQGPGDTVIEEEVIPEPGKPIQYKPYAKPKEVDPAMHEIRELTIMQKHNLIEQEKLNLVDRERKFNEDMQVKHQKAYNSEQDQWDLKERYFDAAHATGEVVLDPKTGKEVLLTPEVRKRYNSQSDLAEKKAKEFHKEAESVRAQMKWGEYGPQQPAKPDTPIRTAPAQGASPATPQAPAQQAITEGTIIKDPKTGRRQIAKGGQWVPLP